MAFTIILVAVVLVAGTNAFGPHFGAGGQWSYVNPLPLPQLPNIPGFPPFPSLPPPPPLLVFGNHPNLGYFGPPITFKTPQQSADDIKNTQPKPGQKYMGVSISTVSHVTRDEDGNIIKTGGSAVTVNDNGNVMTTQTGGVPKKDIPK